MTERLCGTCKWWCPDEWLCIAPLPAWLGVVKRPQNVVPPDAFKDDDCEMWSSSD